jgi:hypothetical protein
MSSFAPSRLWRAMVSPCETYMQNVSMSLCCSNMTGTYWTFHPPRSAAENQIRIVCHFIGLYSMSRDTIPPLETITLPGYVYDK